MQDSINLFFLIWDSILNFIFNSMNILPGVNVGYIIITIIIMIAIINVAVSMPKGSNKEDSDE